MKYVLTQYVTWGDADPNEFPHQWVYLSEGDEMRTSWSPKFSNAFFFDSAFAAGQYMEKYCGKGVEVLPLTEKEIFKRRLEGE